MIAPLRKTARRTIDYVARAVVRRAPYADQVLVVWSLIAGAAWLAITAAGDADGIVRMLLGCILLTELAAICAIDARFGIIPDSMVIALGTSGVLVAALPGFAELFDRMAGAIAAGLVFAAFRYAFRRLRGYDGLGFGDVKFLAAGTMWIGIGAVPSQIMIAAVSALVSALVFRAGRYEIDGRQAIPFGPHLAAGLWLTWVLDL